MRFFSFLAASAPLAAFLLASGISGVVSQDSTTTSHSTHDHDHDDESHTTSSHEDHDHEGEHFEAAAVYDVGAGNNSFIAYPPEGSFEEETFAFMIVPAASADEEGLEGAEEDAEEGKREHCSQRPGRPCSSPL